MSGFASVFAFSVYALNAVFMLIAGLIYLLRESFMPYHADVIGKSWEQLLPAEQLLYLGMMRTEAAGFLAASLAVGILLLIPYRRGERWAAPAIFLIAVVEYLPTAVATYRVSLLSDANPPWVLMCLALVSLLLALLVPLIGGRFFNNENASSV